MNPPQLKPISVPSPSDEENRTTPVKEDWVRKAFPYYEMLRVLSFYLDLEWWIISLGNTDRWHEIRRHRRPNWPMDFDYLYGKREERARYNEEQIQRMLKEKKTFCSSMGDGLWSLYVPIFRKKELIGMMQAGVFLRKAPDRASLLKLWVKLTDNASFEFNPDFFKYVRTMLDCPLVEGPAFRALQEILELYARVVTGEAEPDAVCRRTEELKLNVIAKHLHHQFWLDTLIKNNHFYPPTWRVGKITHWETQEMGFQRLPTTILAVRLDDLGEPQGDDLDLMIRNYHFQRESYKFARTLSNTIAYPLEDYGVLFFTSPEPGHNEVQAKLETLDKIDSISKFASSHFKAKILTGVSRSPVPGENPARIYREAVASMGFCGPLNRPILFYEDVRGNPTVPEPANFFQQATKLIEACTKGNVDEIETLRGGYTEKILAQSSGRPENVRIHFLYALGQIVDILKKRSLVQNENFNFLFGTIEGQLQTARTIADLIAVFRESLKRLLTLTLKPMDVSQDIRLEGARKYIDQNFSQDLKLEQVARENGFSVSVFGRGFKKTAGMGFSAYLRKVRLEEARKLLTTTRLPIAQVSQECGFNNLQYFFDVFKRSTGRTPQDFRDSTHLKVLPEI
jgi:AraC-like DNA-binding protein